MAGLNFQTCTIINSNVDPDSKVKEPLFEGTSNVLKVKRHFELYHNSEAGRILRISKTEPNKPYMCEASISFNGTGQTSLANRLQTVGDKKANKVYCRLDIHLGVEGAEPYIYSSPWVQKGIPFWVEFTVSSTDSASDIANNIKKAIEENHIFQVDKDLIEVSVSGFTLTLKGVNEYQRFRSIKLYRYVALEDESELMASMVKLDDKNYEQADIKEIEYGLNGFGTYSQIIKDLRLPTAANYQWSHIRQVETPIVGAMYTLYIIDYEAPATNDGLGCVGQRMKSVTTHVFWVKSDVVAAFDSALHTTVPDYNPEDGEIGDVSLAPTSMQAAEASPLNE